MTGADAMEALAATWPQAAPQSVGPFAVPSPDPGGNRVSAARLADPRGDSADIAGAEAVMAAQGRQALFQVLDTQPQLNAALEAHGYIARDATDILARPTKGLAAVPPPVTAFDIWPPLAIQREIWAAAGLHPARLAVMERVQGPKTSLLGRIKDKPAAAAFAALWRDVAMVHALEVAPAYRRLGLARHMMAAAAHWAEGSGATQIALLVTQDNTSAQAFYSSLGFQAIGRYHYREQRAGPTL